MNADFIQKALESYALSTELDAWYFDESNEPAAGAQLTPGAAFCRLVKRCPEGVRLCALSHAQAAEGAHNFGEPYINRCHAGMVMITAPVMADGKKHAVCAFPSMMWDWDEVAVAELCSRVEHLPLEREELLSLSRSVTVFSSRQAQARADILALVAERLDQGDTSEKRNRRFFHRQQMNINDVVSENKRTDELSTLDKRLSADYPMHLEQDLLSRVRLGDRSGARGIINDLLGYIFYRTSGNLDIMKARILELVVVISRAAVESGAELNRLFGLNYNSILELSHITTYENVCLWVVKTLDAFMDTVYNTQSLKSSSFLSPALDYIRTNYAESLTLDAVARHIHISSYYLSHLFKDELGITFVDYLTRVRVEEARQLLKHTEFSVQEIALRVGYEDPSYFCKVFKKATGQTPHRYRRGL